MIVSKCPLRISLVGGSTDLQKYLDEYRKGGVISFASDLYTYIVLKEIHRGLEHNIVYGDVKERVSCFLPHQIKNDIVRAVFTHFEVPPLEVVFTADIPSSGSGLASSSSYLINLIEAVTKLSKIEMSQYEICKLAVQLERTFNPMTGYQDAFGCGIGALKRMNFSHEGLQGIKFLESGTFRKMFMYLYPTNLNRSSTAVLNTLDIDKIHLMAPYVDMMEEYITSPKSIYEIINWSWEKKKETSPEIITPELRALEMKMWRTWPKALKLLGAGGGGYFLVIYDRPYIGEGWRPVAIDYKGVTSIYV